MRRLHGVAQLARELVGVSAQAAHVAAAEDQRHDRER